MATGTPTYNPPLTGGSVAAKDDGSSVNTATTTFDFVDGTNFAFVVTDQGSGVTRVVGNSSASGGASLAQGTLAGRGAASGAGVYEEITLGTNLSLSGTTLNANAGSGAPSGAQYVTLAADAGLSAERVLTGSGRVSVTDNATTVDLDIPDAGVTYAKIQNVAARALVGRAADSSGVSGAIAGAGVGTVPIDGGAASTVAFGVFTRLLQNLSLEGDISPAQITADQNDYNPASLSTASILRIDTDAARSITGLSGGADGRVIGVIYVGATSVALANASASSSAANRFLFGADCTLLPEHACVLWYDSTSSRWRMLGRAFPFTAAPVVTLTAGAGLTGGGDTSANRTFTVGANADGSITVNADDVQVGVLATDAQHGNRGGGGIHANAVASGAAGFMSGADKALLDAAVPSARTVTAGAGLTGGGDLSANRTLDVAANADGTIVVNANDIQVGTLIAANVPSALITDAMLANMGALTVKGRSANSTGVPADIAAVAASGAVLRESGSTIGFGTVATAGIADDAVTDAKLRESAALTVIGRGANSTGNPADIAAGTDGFILRRSGTTLAFGTIVEAGLAAIIGNVVFGLTDGANIAVNRDNGKNQKVTLGGNRTVDAPTGTLINGMFLIFEIRQDGTGSRTITFASGAGGFRATGGCSLTPTMSTGAGKTDYVVARYVDADTKWDLVQLTLAA